jgi:DNA-binding XRE family transcriptional regulator
LPAEILQLILQLKGFKVGAENGGRLAHAKHLPISIRLKMHYITLLVALSGTLSYIYREKRIIMPQQIEKVIKERRSMLRLTQEDLAALADVALRTLKAIEVGKGNPSLETLQKIAEVLGMEVRLEVKHRIE